MPLDRMRGEAYQLLRTYVETTASRIRTYSHSMVPGGFDVMS